MEALSNTLMTSSVDVGLPGLAYYDQSIFDQEKNTIFQQSWQFAGRVSDFPPGSYRTMIIGRNSILITRCKGNLYEDGQLHAMHNVCVHRGTHLLSGCGFTSKIQCPYHAWEYDVTGQLKSIRNPREFPNIDIKKMRLKAVQVDTWGGFVFVNPSLKPTETLIEWLAEYPSYLEDCNLNWHQLEQVDAWNYVEQINWKLIVENYTELYHFQVTHRESIGSLYDLSRTPTLPTGRHLRYPLAYDKSPGSELEYRWIEGAVSRQGFIFPNLMIDPDKYYISVWYLVPLSPIKTKIEVLIYQTPEQKTLYSFDRTDFNKVMQEDLQACHRVQATVTSPAYAVGGLAVNQELGIHHFHSTLREFCSYGGGSQ